MEFVSRAFGSMEAAGLSVAFASESRGKAFERGGAAFLERVDSLGCLAGSHTKELCLGVRGLG